MNAKLAKKLRRACRDRQLDPDDAWLGRKRAMVNSMNQGTTKPRTLEESCGRWFYKQLKKTAREVSQ